MRHKRLLELKRILLEQRAGLNNTDPFELLEEVIGELEPLLDLLDYIRSPIGDLTEGLDQYERQTTRK